MTNSTTFIPRQTLITANWLNDVNTAVYSGQLLSWIIISDYGAMGGIDEHVKFQAAIDALPASGGTILLAPNVDYSATVTTTLSVGNKAVLWRVQNGATAPTGLPGMTLSQRYGATYIVAVESSRNGQTFQQMTGTIPVPDNEKARAYHVEATMPDRPASDVNRDLIAYSYLMETDHHGPLGGEVRGMKGIVRGNGGQANLRSVHVLTEGYNGHTGDITGVLSDVFHSDSTPGAAAVGKSAAYIGQVGAGIKEVFTARSRFTNGFPTTMQTVDYAFRQQEGSNAVLARIASFQAHGGGAGSLYRGLKSDTDSTVVFDVHASGHVEANSFNSGNQNGVLDQTAFSITPPQTSGMLFIQCAASSTQWLACVYVVTSSPAVATIAIGTSTNQTTGVLTGTTGTNGKLTVSAANDGKIYVENRLGATRNLAWTFFSAPH